jgi:hypothetical protein
MNSADLTKVLFLLDLPTEKLIDALLEAVHQLDEKADEIKTLKYAHNDMAETLHARQARDFASDEHVVAMRSLQARLNAALEGMKNRDSDIKGLRDALDAAILENSRLKNELRTMQLPI